MGIAQKEDEAEEDEDGKEDEEHLRNEKVKYKSGNKEATARARGQKRATFKETPENYTTCNPQLLRFDTAGRPLRFNEGLLKNEYANGKGRELSRFELHMREPSELHMREPSELHMREPSELHMREPSELHMREPSELHMREPSELHMREPSELYMREPSELHMREPSELYMREPSERWDADAWESRENNIYFLITGKTFEFTDQERRTLEMILGVAEEIGVPAAEAYGSEYICSQLLYWISPQAWEIISTEY